MKIRFAVFGFIVSVAVHAAALFLLSLSSAKTTGAPVPAGEPPTEKATEAAPASVPASVPAPAPAPAPERRTVSLPVARPSPAHEPAPTPEAEWVTYTVKRGDRLERLVRKAGCSISEAARYNKTTVGKLSALKVGQRIKLPKFKED